MAVWKWESGFGRVDWESGTGSQRFGTLVLGVWYKNSGFGSTGITRLVWSLVLGVGF